MIHMTVLLEYHNRFAHFLPDTYMYIRSYIRSLIVDNNNHLSVIYLTYNVKCD